MDTPTMPESVAGPGFSTLGGAVQQPGTIERAPHEIAPTILREHNPRAAQVELVASSKHAQLQHLVDNVRAYQILPQDLRRKSALIRIPSLAAGQPQSLAVANPAAGSQFSANPSPNAPFQLLGISYTLTTSGTAANRTPGIIVAGQVSFINSIQAASLSFPYSFFPGATAIANGNSAPLPAGPYPAGTTVNSDVSSIQAADQISAITIIWEPLPSTSGVLIGNSPSVETGQGFLLLPGDPFFPYTGGSPLWAKAQSAVPVQVNTFLEMFDGVATVN